MLKALFYSKKNIRAHQNQDTDLVINQLKQEILELKKANEDLQKDNQRVYQGHAGLMEEINFLKFRLEETCRLHDEVVTRYWSNDKSREKYICLYPF